MTLRFALVSLVLLSLLACRGAATEPAIDALEGAWIGVRLDAQVRYEFAMLGQQGENPATGNPAKLYAVSEFWKHLRDQFTAYREGQYVYWGSSSRGEIVNDTLMQVWSATLEPYPVFRNR